MRVCPACGSARCSDAWLCADCGHRPESIHGFPAFAPHLATASTGFRPGYFATLAALEGSSFWFRARNELIAWALRAHAPAAGRILEIGCGTGFVLNRIRADFPSAELAGSEILSAGLPFAAERVPSAAFYQMDARAIPFRAHFDVVGLFDVLEHIDDDVTVLEEVAGALRAGGSIVLTVPQHPALWSAQDEHAHHVRRYTAGGLRRKLEGAGFEMVRATSFVSLLLPFLVATRRRMGAGPADDGFDVMAQLRQPRAVNVALEAVMSVERAMIRAGVSFPAGGSLLVFASRRAGPLPSR